MAREQSFKVKISLVGPCESGKTMLANFLADATENPIEEYQPTHVVRVLEFETNLNNSGRNVRADVELWDCSGNAKFQSSWPALYWESHGAIFVFNPEVESHAAELDRFHEHFAQKAGLQDSQCVAFAHVKDMNSNRRGVKLSKKFNRIPQLEVNIDEEGNKLRGDFNTFISGLVSNLSDRRDQEEMNIMNMRS